jgi:poly(3-hydroxybutyrate) depolymerase
VEIQASGRSKLPIAAMTLSGRLGMDRLAQSRIAFVVLLAICGTDACHERELLGINSVTATQACANKPCGDDCAACSTDSCTAPDIVGHCGADGMCAESAASCSSDAGGTRSQTAGSGGQQAGTDGQTAGIGGKSGSVDASPGCGKSGAPTGQLVDQTITIAGQARTYALTVPPDYSEKPPLPLIVGWHGANVDGAKARKIFNLDAATNGAAVIVYPYGLPTSAMTWDLSSDGADSRLFTDLVTFISSEYCIDSNRIFTTGHSTGAAMANILGCYSRGLRAIALVAGMNQGVRADCTGQVAVWITQGQNDPVVDVSQGQRIRDFWIGQNGCTAQTTTWGAESACDEYLGCKTDRPVVWCVHDEGHAWPNLTTDCNGGTCFDAGSAIWTFFSSFR